MTFFMVKVGFFYLFVTYPPHSTSFLVDHIILCRDTALQLVTAQGMYGVKRTLPTDVPNES
jgi:hypothetical protein